MHTIPLNERVIFALDFAESQTAKEWIDRLDGSVKFFKVGLTLFLSGPEGWDVMDYIVKRGNKLMVDLKFFDIPETVAHAVSQLRNRGATFVTIHGNEPIIRAAVAEKGDLNILAVTVLTSFDESDMRDMGLTCSIEDFVLMRAKKAIRLGCDGVVASALEADRLRREIGQNFVIVTPGIRPGVNRDEIGTDDQKRVATAKEAMEKGADYVVIGRPIRYASDPLAAVKEIQREIEEGLAQRRS